MLLAFTKMEEICLENPMDGGAWWAAVHGVTKSRTRLSDFTFIFHFHTLEKEMATHSSVLAWRIPGTGEPGGLPSMGSHRVGHDWSDLAAAAAGSQEFYFERVKLKRPRDTQVERSNGRQLDMESNTQVIKVRVLSTYMMFKTMRLNEII